MQIGWVANPLHCVSAEVRKLICTSKPKYVILHHLKSKKACVEDC